MDERIQRALEIDALVDITTTGRRSGAPSRIEIAFHNFDGALYITGLPGKRDWYANLLANPRFTFHLKQSALADLPAVATPVDDEATRRAVLSRVVAKWNREAQLEAFVQGSPLVEVRLQDV